MSKYRGRLRSKPASEARRRATACRTSLSISSSGQLPRKKPEGDQEDQLQVSCGRLGVTSTGHHGREAFLVQGRVKPGSLTGPGHLARNGAGNDLIYLGATAVLAKRQPALLNMILAQRLQVASGSRYAITTLTTYAIAPSAGPAPGYARAAAGHHPS